MVFSGVFPIEAADYESLRDALEKLSLNDSAFTYEPETSQALGLRLPLRLPGPAAHGDRPGAAGAGVRALAHHHRAVGGVPGDRHRREGGGDRQPGASSRRRSGSPSWRSRTSPATSTPAPRTWAAILKLCQDRRGIQKDLTLPRHPAGPDHLRDPAGRGGLRLLRQAEERLPRLRLARLRAEGVRGGRPGQARHPHQRRAGGRAVDHRPPRARPTSAAATCARSCAR